MRRLSLPSRLAQSALLAALALALSVPALAADITVDSATDDGTGGCTLREAVEAANTDTAVGGCTAGDDASDTILFDPGVTFVQLLSQITITEDLVITGNGSTVTTVSGASANRVFEVQGATLLSIGDVEITSAGSTSITGYPADGGALYISGAGDVTTDGVLLSGHQVSGSGGAIWVSATGSLDVQASTTFAGNRARGNASTQGGGAIYTDGGTVSVTNATFTDNRALGTSGSGGAILNPNGATLLVGSSTLTGNRSQRAGGAIETVGGFTNVSFSTFTGNTAGANPGNGGAIHGGGAVDLSITGGNASGNRATEGGAFWIGASGELTMANVSVTGNIADGASADQGGGGVYVDGGTLTINSGVASLSPPLRTTADASRGALNFFFDNRATGASGSGGAILVNGGTVTIGDATFDSNRARRAGGAIEVTAPTAATPVSVSIGNGFFGSNIAASAPGNGGGIHTTTGVVDLTVSGSSFSGNDAFSEGGALWINTGTTLALSDSYLASNVARGAAADNGGGGLFVNGGDATVTTTTFENNTTAERTAAGGGLLNVGGVATVSQSLFTGNAAGFGGGVASVGEAAAVVLQNATLYGNSARFGGGGFSASGILDLNSVTIASNAAAIGGGGLYNQNTQNQGSPFVSLTNTIVADNTAGNAATDPNLKGRYGSGGYNVIGTSPSAATFPATGTDQTGTDPLLEMLADNGGPTLTAALQAGSPAIDTGSTVLTVDQRGVARTEPDDVGAVEFGDAAPPAASALVITGVVDGPLSGGTPKAVEFYVLEDIADLSAYGFGSANNGGGTDGEEFSFPAVATTAGTYLYVASEATGFTEFFGFAPDYTDSAASINGDDAIELFQDGGVVDVFGDINVDGTGTPWDSVDGWVYRKDATGPDGTTFVLDNFTYSGTDALDGEMTNATATTPWPIGTYSPVLVSLAPARAASLTAADLDALKVVPNPFGSRAQATFALTDAQAVTVTLYDVMGRQVQQVFAGQAQAETPMTVSVDGGALASGIYVLVLQGETVRATRQVTVVR